MAASVAVDMNANMQNITRLSKMMSVRNKQRLSNI